MWWASCLVRDLQLPAAVDDIGGQAVQYLDLRVAGAIAQILLGEIPEGVTLHNGMDTIRRRFGGGALHQLQVVKRDPGVDARLGFPGGLLHLLAQQDTGFSALHNRLSADSGLGDNVVVVILHPGGNRLGGGVVLLRRSLEFDLAAKFNHPGSGDSRRGRLGRLGIGGLPQQGFHIRTEGIHGLAVLGEPVHDIAVVGGDAQLGPLAVADNVLLGQTIQLAQIAMHLKP